MKIFIFITVCALILMMIDSFLAQNVGQLNDGIWSDLMSGFNAFWSPFLFAFVIVGFGTWAVRRISR